MLRAPRTRGHRSATRSPCHATQDRHPLGPSPPPAARTRPCGAGPSCAPGVPERWRLRMPSNSSGRPGSHRLPRWRRRAARAGPHLGRCCSSGAAARAARPALRAPHDRRCPTARSRSPCRGPRKSASSAAPSRRPYLGWKTHNRSACNERIPVVQRGRGSAGMHLTIVSGRAMSCTGSTGSLARSTTCCRGSSWFYLSALGCVPRPCAIAPRGERTTSRRRWRAR
jgi:hypothetical protein